MVFNAWTALSATTAAKPRAPRWRSKARSSSTSSSTTNKNGSEAMFERGTGASTTIRAGRARCKPAGCVGNRRARLADRGGVAFAAANGGDHGFVDAEECGCGAGGGAVRAGAARRAAARGPGAAGADPERLVPGLRSGAGAGERGGDGGPLARARLRERAAPRAAGRPPVRLRRVAARGGGGDGAALSGLRGAARGRRGQVAVAAVRADAGQG